MGDLDRVRFGSKIVDRRTSEMLAEAQRLAQAEDPSIKDFRLTQGSFSNHVGASAGTHSGPGSFDMYTAAYTAEQKEVIGMALRTVGFASWRRRAIPGTWNEHWHGIAMDTEGLPPVAARQVTSYLNGRDGLKGNRKDPDPRPKEIHTWEEYKQERPEFDQVTGSDQPDPKTAPVGDPYGIESGEPLDRDTDADGLTDKFEKLAGTNIRSGDSDSDGLSDAYEAVQSHTDPLAKDTDADGQSDVAELTSGSDAGRLPGIAGVVGTGVFAENIRGGVKDADSDGLSDHVEKLVGLDPKNADSDDDGLSDSVEASLGTDPLLADTDHDGLTDDLEVEYGSDPLGSFIDSSGRTVKTAPWTLEAAYARLNAEEGHDHAEDTEAAAGTTAAAAAGDPYAIDSGQTLGQSASLPGADKVDKDTDRDGLTDAFEQLAGTKVRDADSDNDGLSDGYEALKSRTDPLAKDTDKDKLTDAQEVSTGSDAGTIPGVAGVVGTGALAENVRDGFKDADSDGLSDRVEKLVRTDAKKADTDGDKLTDAIELAFGTNPLLGDTDRDGISDAIEVQYGMDPLAPGSTMAPAVPDGGQPVGGLPADAPAETYDPS